MVENFIAIQTTDTINLLKKGAYNTKIEEIEKKRPNHDKYVTTQELNKLTGDNFTDRLKQAYLVSKNYIANFIKKTNFNNKLKSFNKKVTLNKTRHLEVKKIIMIYQKKLN